MAQTAKPLVNEALASLLKKAASLILPLAAATSAALFETRQFAALPHLDIALSFIALVASIFIGIFSYQISRKIRNLSGTPRVFISYSHSNANQISPIRKALQQSGKKVWLDVENIRPGDSINLTIEHAMDNSDAVVFVLPKEMTPAARRELSMARTKGIKIIPVKVTRNSMVPVEIQDVKYIDMTTEGPGALRQLVSAVES